MHLYFGASMVQLERNPFKSKSSFFLCFCMNRANSWWNEFIVTAGIILEE